MKVQMLVQALDRRAPFETACGFDHCGLLVGGAHQEVTRVGVALDVTPRILARAVQKGCDVLVTHHPVIFHPLGTLDPQGMAYQLAAAGIACIAVHTNLDKARGGVNEVLAVRAGLIALETPPETEGLARMGRLPNPLAVETYVALLKEMFGVSMLRYYSADKPVQRVMTVAGSGGDFLETALTLGADTLVTGDLKHDRFVEAQIRGLNLIELNHYDAEAAALPALTEWIQAAGFDAVLLEVDNPVKVG